MLVEGKQKDKKDATAQHHEVNWSDKLLTPRVADNGGKSWVIFRKQARFIWLFSPWMNADDFI